VPVSRELTGILNVSKPRGWTSHDVVARVRRLADQKRVGHAGTLDPMAEGVLPVLLGRATRLADFIHTGRKTYRAVIQLGSATDTDDTEGKITLTSPVPPLSEPLLRERLTAFEGDIIQVPPKYSALKVAGRRAYAVARAGGVVELEPRHVTIHDLGLLGYDTDELCIEVTCSTGTYIRALARDIAASLGTVGHLKGLTRTQVGPFSLADAVSVDMLAAGGVASHLLSSAMAVPGAPSFTAEAGEAARLANGQAVEARGLRAESVWVYDPDGLLVCLASADGAQVRPRLQL
jgi:tRNA pseudouridine55 synthase